MWPKLWNSAKKVCPWWIAVFSLVLAMWPLPSAWDFTITVNLRLVLAVILFGGIVFWMLIDFSTVVYHSSLCFEEKVHKTVPVTREDGRKHYEIFINYNPAYKSMTSATVYLRTNFVGTKPVYERLCNGKVVNLKEDAATRIVCVPDAACSGEKLSILESELMNVDRRDHKQLIVLPFFEEEVQ